MEIFWTLWSFDNEQGKQSEVLAEFDGSIQNKGQLLSSFLLGSKSTVHDVYKISANSFLSCFDSEWVGEWGKPHYTFFFRKE